MIIVDGKSYTEVKFAALPALPAATVVLVENCPLLA
jgi:hypothetical protein